MITADGSKSITSSAVWKTVVTGNIL